jgi:ADP-dependent NAD(P)H-hydrate dehydratase / NAD(P)H-hydrate epimerase
MGRPIITPQEMVAAEQAVFKAGTDSFEVMTRAGTAVAEFLHARWPEGKVQVLCGPGGNGGDGFIAAARLAKLWRDVEVFCLVEKSALTGDAAKAAALWEGHVRPLEEALEAPHAIVLDALFGGGLSRPLDGVAAVLAERGGRVVSVDVPSGIDGLTAKPLGPCFRAEGTITFAGLRPAHLLQPGAAYCGLVAAADIGIPVQSQAFENSPMLWAGAMPRPGQDGYKHQRGHLKVVSGPASATGAARLSAMAGLRAGAGLVTVMSPPGAMTVNAGHLTAVMIQVFDGAGDLATAAQQAQVMVIGPAAGITPATRANVEALLKSPARILLDADALTVFDSAPASLFKRLRPDDIMTPHMGEFRRLFSDLADTGVNKIEVARKAARDAGCVVLLKGADTVIAAPDGRAIVNTHATPWLATAGAGDVLAGLIAGFMAQGMPTLEAAAMGAWVHGEAGRRVGAGLISEDLERQIPDILSALHGEIA